MIFYKPFILIGSLAALLAVVFGAFGAHALKARVTPDLLAVFQTGVQYHFWLNADSCGSFFASLARYEASV